MFKIISIFDDDFTKKMGDLKTVTKPNNLLPQDGEVFFYPDYFTIEDSNRLFKSLCENIEWKQEQIKGWGKVNPLPRLTAWYGEGGKTYKYSGISHTPNP